MYSITSSNLDKRKRHTAVHRDLATRCFAAFTRYLVCAVSPAHTTDCCSIEWANRRPAMSMPSASFLDYSRRGKTRPQI